MIGWASGKKWKRSRSRDNGQRTPLDLDDFLDVLVNGMGGLVVGVVGESGLGSRRSLDRAQILEVDVKAICKTISHRPHLLAMMGDRFFGGNSNVRESNLRAQLYHRRDCGEAQQRPP